MRRNSDWTEANGGVLSLPKIGRIPIRVHRPLQGTPVLPAPLMGPDRSHAFAVEPLGEAEPAQHARRIGGHIDPAADLGQLRRLLVNLDLEPGLQQRQGSGEATNAAADHRDAERRAYHSAVTLGPTAALRRLRRLRPSRAAS